MMRMPFMPGRTFTMPVTPESSRLNLEREGGTARIVNDSKVNVWIEFGCTDVVASPTTSMLLTPGYTSQVKLPPRTGWLAAICPAKGSGSLNITLGEGA